MSSFRTRAAKPVLRTAVAAFLALFPPFVLAQGTVLRGVVRDELQKPLRDVRIVLVDPERGTSFETRTNKKGEFMQVGIPAAAYRATFELAGYITHETAIVVKAGMEEKASIVLKKVPPRIDRDPDFALGIERFQEGRFQEAVDLFLKVRERFPDAVETYYDLGVAYLRLGRTESAVEALAKAIELKPDAAEPRLALGEGYVLLGRTAEAEEAFRRAVALAPDDPAARLDLGLLYYKSDKIDDALACFDEAIRLDPKSAAAHYRAGLANLKKGDAAKAAGHFEAFLAISPDGPEAPQVRAMLEELKKKR